VRVVPSHQLSVRAQSDIAEQHGLHYRGFEFEIGGGLRPALRGLDPFLVMAVRARQRFWRRLEGAHFRIWDEAGLLTIEAAHDRAAVSDKQQALVLLAHSQGL